MTAQSREALKESVLVHRLLVLSKKADGIHLTARKLKWYHRLVRQIFPKCITNKIFKCDPSKIRQFILEHSEIFNVSALDQDRLFKNTKEYFTKRFSANEFDLFQKEIIKKLNQSAPSEKKSESPLTQKEVKTSPPAALDSPKNGLTPIQESPVKETPTELLADQKFKEEVLDLLKTDSKEAYEELGRLKLKSPFFQAERRTYNSTIDRYRDILPNISTLVHEGVNGNWINLPNTRPFIAVSAPKPAGFSDYFEMLEKEGVEHIVVLETSPNKIARYWPLEEDDPEKFHGYSWKGQSQIPGAQFREIRLEKEGRELTIHEYLSWPDMGVIDSFDFFDFMSEFERKASKNSPTVVHCSAGVGRAGTFIAFNAALSNRSYGSCLSVAQIIALMRTQRQGMVQKDYQYLSVLEALKCAEKYQGRSLEGARLKRAEKACRAAKLEEFHEKLAIETGDEPLNVEIDALSLDLSVEVEIFLRKKDALGNFVIEGEKPVLEKQKITLRQVTNEVIKEINTLISSNDKDTSVEKQRQVFLDMNKGNLRRYHKFGVDLAAGMISKEDEPKLWLRQILTALVEKKYIFSFESVGGGGYFVQA